MIEWPTKNKTLRAALDAITQVCMNGDDATLPPRLESMRERFANEADYVLTACIVVAETSLNEAVHIAECLIKSTDDVETLLTRDDMMHSLCGAVTSAKVLEMFKDLKSKKTNDTDNEGESAGNAAQD